MKYINPKYSFILALLLSLIFVITALQSGYLYLESQYLGTTITVLVFIIYVLIVYLPSLFVSYLLIKIINYVFNKVIK